MFSSRSASAASATVPSAFAYRARLSRSLSSFPPRLSLWSSMMMRSSHTLNFKFWSSYYASCFSSASSLLCGGCTVFAVSAALLATNPPMTVGNLISNNNHKEEEENNNNNDDDDEEQQLLDYIEKHTATNNRISEYSSGVMFDTYYNGSQDLPLCAIGCRVRYAFFKVYAIAIYGELFGSPSLMSESSVGAQGNGNGNGNRNRDSFLLEKGRKVLHLKFIRNVDGKTMVDALDDALKPRIIQLQAQTQTESESESSSSSSSTDLALAEFRKELLQAFAVDVHGNSSDNVTELVFDNANGLDTIAMYLKKASYADFKHVCEIVDRRLLIALFDTYLGVNEPSVISSLESDFDQRNNCN